MMNHVTIIMKIDLKKNKKTLTYTMVQNILSSKQIFWKCCNYGTKPIFQSIGPILRSPLQRIELSYLFFGQPRSNQGTKMSYQMLVQWAFLHKNHNFATHIPNLFFKAIKVLIHFVISSSWVHIHKRKLLRHQVQACDVIKNQIWMLFYILI
jgi:hypothetical protein